MNSLKIATHDSATGERGKGLLSWLVTPFSRTQSKTIRQQYDAGCRYFDIRVRLVDCEWRCAHGLWTSRRTADDIIYEINDFPEPCAVQITYEGRGDERIRSFLICHVEFLRELYTNIQWGGVALKYGSEATGVKVKYEYVLPATHNIGQAKQGFLPLDGRSWHTYLPIPWLWKKLYGQLEPFTPTHWVFVDFL